MWIYICPFVFASLVFFFLCISPAYPSQNETVFSLMLLLVQKKIVTIPIMFLPKSLLPFSIRFYKDTFETRNGLSMPEAYTLHSRYS